MTNEKHYASLNQRNKQNPIFNFVIEIKFVVKHEQLKMVVNFKIQDQAN